MKKIFSFLCMLMAMTAMISCSSSKEEKGTTGTGNAALDNIFERKSVRTYLNKGVEKEKIDLMLRAGMSAPVSYTHPHLHDEIHTVTGTIAILLMFVHASWAIWTYVKGSAEAKRHFILTKASSPMSAQALSTPE